MKFSKKPIMAVALVALSAGATQAAPVQWTSGSGGNDHWYEVVFGTAAITWANADSAATSATHLGATGYLASVTSALEQAFLNTLNPNNTQAWLGGTDAAVEGVWTWTSGETFAYSNWNFGEPNNAGNNEDYLVGWWSGDRWNDLPNSWNGVKSYVVEYSPTISPIPLPASLPLILAGLGLVGFVGRRKSGRKAA